MLRGKIMGRSTCLAISRIISSEKALGFVDVPMRTWGLTCWTTESRSRFLSSGHSESSLAKGIWAGVNLSPRDLRRRPGLSRHLDYNVLVWVRFKRGREHTYHICFDASDLDLRDSVAMVSAI